MPKTCSSLVLSEANQLVLLSGTRVSSHHNRYIAIAYPQEMWQPLVTSPDPAFLAAGPMRLSPSAAGAICEFFSQSAWVVGSHRSIHRTSWVEIMADFVFQFGYFPGFINQSMTLKVLVQRFQASCHATVPIPPAVHYCPEIYTFVEFWILPRSFPAHFSFIPFSGSYLRFLDGVCLQICCKK